MYALLSMSHTHLSSSLSPEDLFQMKLRSPETDVQANHTAPARKSLLHGINPLSRTTVHLRAPPLPERSMKQQQQGKGEQQQEKGEEEDALASEVLQEVLRDAGEHPVQRGERAEWREHVGVGRREDTRTPAHSRESGRESSRESGREKQQQQSLRGQSTHTQAGESTQAGAGAGAVGEPHLLSRGGGVTVTCDTRGNLGPCSVLNQGE
jgi:hypothetical protein